MRRLLPLLASLLAGCTLLAHSSEDLPRCEDDEGCAAVNARFSIPASACDRYRCIQNVCALVGAQPERCNGADDDCDAIVDEGALVSTDAASELAPRVIASDVAAARTLYGAPDATGELALALADGADGARLRFVPEAAGRAATLTPWTQAEQVRGAVGSPFDGFTPTMGCYLGDPCDMEDAALAQLAPDRWLLASIQTRRCATGNLRVAWFDPAEGRAFSVGPPARAAPALGIDADEGGCTGSLSGLAEGASGPAIAALGDDGPRPQALVAYLARAADAPSCDGAEVQVRAIGAWFERATLGGVDTGWVGASGANRPDTLGRTTGGGRPAIAPLGGIMGFSALVAHGAVGGGIDVHVVAPAAATPAGITTCDPDTSCFEPHATAPLSFASLGRLDAPGADHVALAIGPRRDGRLEVGVVYQTGCADGDARFLVASIDPAGGGAITASPPVALGPTTQPPQVVYLEGAVEEGFTRGAVAGASTTGAWLTVWVEGPQLMARRILALDGQPLDEAQPITRPDGARVGGRPVLVPRLDARGVAGSARFATRDGAELTSGVLVCR